MAFIFVPISQFPKPKGPYGVGQKSLHWIDENRKEEYVHDLSHPNREIMAYMFYPTKKEKTEQILQDHKVTENITNYFSSLTGLPKWMFSGLYYSKTNAIPNAKIAKTRTKFPVIIFSPGSPVLPRNYTWLLEEIASHGFVVAAINHTYITSKTYFPDGRTASWVYPKMKKQLKQKVKSGELSKKESQRLSAEWNLKNFYTTYVQDIRFAVDKIQELAQQGSEFWNGINSSKIGVLGHSFGGSAAVRACKTDDRITCGINMDGSIRSEDAKTAFKKPFMFMIAGNSHLWNPNHPRYPFRGKKTIRSTLIKKEKLNPKKIKTTRYKEDANMSVVTIGGIGHTAFINTPLLLNTTLLTRALSRYYDFSLEAPSCKASKILVDKVSPRVVRFFDKHLK